LFQSVLNNSVSTAFTIEESTIYIQKLILRLQDDKILR